MRSNLFCNHDYQSRKFAGVVVGRFIKEHRAFLRDRD